MRSMQRRWMIIVPATLLVTAVVPTLASAAAAAAAAPAAPKSPAASKSWHPWIDCGSETKNFTCADVYDPTAIGYGKYVGHDEPSALFYSRKPGSGNKNVTLTGCRRTRRYRPVSQEPAGPTTSSCTRRSGSAWRCATPSRSLRPTQTCKPDRDSNIYNSPDPSSPRYIGQHPGTAFMEMQFYPPGWVSWPPGTAARQPSGAPP